jgi:hypothetical protein
MVLLRVYGLERAMSGELLEFEDGSLGNCFKP